MIRISVFTAKAHLAYAQPGILMLLDCSLDFTGRADDRHQMHEQVVMYVFHSSRGGGTLFVSLL
jgi:hypothetical protein